MSGSQRLNLLKFMTKKIKYLIVLNVVLLGLISLSLQRSRTSSTLDQMATAFAIADTAQLQGMKIGGLLLRREQADAWSVNKKYLASPTRIDQLLTLLPRIEVKRPAPQHLLDSLLMAFGQNGFMLESYSSEGLIKQYPVVGFNGETYAMLEEDKPYALYIPGYRQDIASWLSPNSIGKWRDRHVLYATWKTLKNLKIEVSQQPKQNLEIYFDKDFYTVEGVSQLDSARLFDYISQYVRFEAEEFLALSKKSPVFQQNPAATITIEDLSRKSQAVMEIYISQDSIYGWLPQEEEAVLLDPNQLAGILQPPSAFQRQQ